MATKQISKNPTSKPTPKAPTEKKPTLSEMASNENTGISRVLAEHMDSNEFCEAISALQYSPMYKHAVATLNLPKEFDQFDVDMFAAWMYLAGRFDERGEPTKL